MPEIVVSETTFGMMGYSVFDVKESVGNSGDALWILIRATWTLAPGGIETIYSDCCFPVMMVAQPKMPSTARIKTGIMIFVRTNWRVDLR